MGKLGKSEENVSYLCLPSLSTSLSEPEFVAYSDVSVKYSARHGKKLKIYC